MAQTVVWGLFIAACIFLLILFGKRIFQINKLQRNKRREYEHDRVKYRHFTSEMFDETPDDKLIYAVIYHIMAKEDKLYEDEKINGTLKDVLTHSELLVYTIFQVESSMEGRRGSIHSFFINEPYCLYRPYLKEAFVAVGCYEIAELLASAEKLALMIENDEEIEIDDSDYGRYNFADYTNALMSMLKASEIILKTGEFIRKNKKDFIDMEVVSDE